MWVHGTAAVVNVSANVLLMPRFGPLTAAYVTFGTYALAAFGVWALSRESLRTRVSPVFVLKSLAASGAIAAALAFAAPRGITALALAALAACGAYVGLMLAMRGVTVVELKQLAGLLRRER